MGFFANDLLRLILYLFYTMEMMSNKKQSKVNFVLDLKMVMKQTNNLECR